MIKKEVTIEQETRWAGSIPLYNLREKARKNKHRITFDCRNAKYTTLEGEPQVVCAVNKLTRNTANAAPLLSSHKGTTYGVCVLCPLYDYMGKEPPPSGS